MKPQVHYEEAWYWKDQEVGGRPFTYPWEGDTGWPAVTEACRRIDYSGWISKELPLL